MKRQQEEPASQKRASASAKGSQVQPGVDVAYSPHRHTRSHFSGFVKAGRDKPIDPRSRAQKRAKSYCFFTDPCQLERYEERNRREDGFPQTT